MTEIIKFAVSSVLSFVLTFILLKTLPGEMIILGHDRGKKYVEGSSVNKGKPTGVGFYFVMVFAVLCLTLCKFTLVNTLMVVLVVLSMVFGLLDDRSATPWGEYIKGFLDFLIAIAGGIIFSKSFVIISISGTGIGINKILYAVLATILIIVSINATNATDGVDGLSGMITILTLCTLTVASAINGTLDLNTVQPAMIMVIVLSAYMIFNHYPSKMLMGDAGSRAIGLFIAYYAISLNIPFAYLIVGLPFMLDGGISILKITIGRLTKKRIIILKNIITPFHDHLKKKLGFTVPKTWQILVLATSIIDIIYLVIVMIGHNI